MIIKKFCFFQKDFLKPLPRSRMFFGHLKWNEIKMEMKEDDSTEETRNCRI
jgi:hypothetical protein